MERNLVIQVPGVLSLLGIAFIILKLCNVITWSWIAVLAPFWIPVLIVFCGTICALLILLVYYIIKLK